MGGGGGMWLDHLPNSLAVIQTSNYTYHLQKADDFFHGTAAGTEPNQEDKAADSYYDA